MYFYRNLAKKKKFEIILLKLIQIKKKNNSPHIFHNFLRLRNRCTGFAEWHRWTSSVAQRSGETDESSRRVFLLAKATCAGPPAFYFTFFTVPLNTRSQIQVRRSTWARLGFRTFLPAIRASVTHACVLEHRCF